ncbi:MAG: M20/M25/M40 family metallo-hydrolase [Alphaproteobacteria bacterium]|nr:M20/M25/M40 family metallo-hydrolase [Alphaproteobacteria bacterium]MBV9372878.1 M20/M25/M40 family metallo-hydrolase [Alphaproteobacteria bacterium]MBV9902066.1 M20/M25/M40 family metallo-hydrolase [Alphaproteobacteria bacterium]
MKRSAFLLLALLVLLAAAMGLKGRLVSAPDVPAAAPGAFDTERALARLARILGDQRPHPVDSAAQDGVRARLVAELRAMGLDPVVTDDFACNGPPRERTIACARIRNLLVTIGPAQGKHLLFVSHYDSTPVGPGASDDGIGVASMLELAALLKDRPLRRPVTFLFDEGEETGLIGARAFLARNPLAARVDTLVNLESRGVAGPAIMFETSLPNGAAVAAFQRALVRPVANSLTTGFYKLIPNSTDVAVFEERRWTILNFAVIGNETRYHSPGDTLDRLDPRSLAHMGRQALALGRALGEGEAPEARGGRLYADLLQRALLVVPAWLGTALLWILLLAFAVLAWRRRPGRSLAVVGAALAAAPAAVFLLQSLLGLLRPGEFWRAHPGGLALAVDVTALAVAAAALLRLGADAPRDGLRLAFWLAFLVLGTAIGLVVPGAIVFFLAPPLLAGLGLAMGRGGRLLALLAWLLLFLSWAPLLHLSEILLDLDAAWIFAPVSALLVLPPLIELQPLLRRHRRPAAMLLAALAAAAWAVPAAAPAYSAERPQRLSLEYVWDADAAKARWMVYPEGGPLPEAIAALGPFEHEVEPPWSPYERWAAPARGPAVAPPTVDRLGEIAWRGGGRTLVLRLHARGSEVVRLRFPSTAALAWVDVGGAVRRFGRGKDKQDYVFRCHGRGCDGLVFALGVRGHAPLAAIATGMRSGLPPQGAALLAGRPATAQPQYSADATYVVAKLRL